MAYLQKPPFLSHPKKIFAYLLSFTTTAGLVQQPDKIVVRFAHTIYPYSLAWFWITSVLLVKSGFLGYPV
jgi:hypothetical protein